MAYWYAAGVQAMAVVVDEPMIQSCASQDWRFLHYSTLLNGEWKKMNEQWAVSEIR